jgi:hypothetical protein
MDNYEAIPQQPWSLTLNYLTLTYAKYRPYSLHYGLQKKDWTKPNPQKIAHKEQKNNQKRLPKKTLTKIVRKATSETQQETFKRAEKKAAAQFWLRGLKASFS